LDFTILKAFKKQIIQQAFICIFTRHLYEYKHQYLAGHGNEKTELPWYLVSGISAKIV